MKFDAFPILGLLLAFVAFLANFDTLVCALYIERLRRIIAHAF